jgi:hypothetical protein
VHELPRRRAERPHVDLERVVQAAVAVGNIRLRTQTQKKGTQKGLTFAFLAPGGKMETDLRMANANGRSRRDAPASILLQQNLTVWAYRAASAQQWKSPLDNCDESKKKTQVLEPHQLMGTIICYAHSLRTPDLLRSKLSDRTSRWAI